MKFNERADELTIEAALRLRRRPDYDRWPVSFVKRQHREESLDERNRRYTSEETAGTTKIFLPDVRFAHTVVKKLNLHMVLTGHGGFADYLHRFKYKDDPGCVCDNNVSETIIHLLMDCPQHGAAREDLQQELQMKLCKESIMPTILSGASGRDGFIKYAIRIAKTAIERNRTIDR